MGGECLNARQSRWPGPIHIDARVSLGCFSSESLSAGRTLSLYPPHAMSINTVPADVLLDIADHLTCPTDVLHLYLTVCN